MGANHKERYFTNHLPDYGAVSAQQSFEVDHQSASLCTILTEVLESFEAGSSNYSDPPLYNGRMLAYVESAWQLWQRDVVCSAVVFAFIETRMETLKKL